VSVLFVAFVGREALTHTAPAALKCRQRKKAWLSQLQAKVEFLTQENERLQAALVSAREEIARLSAAAVIPVQGSNHPGAPVSVNVSLPQGQKVAAGGGRGYGY
jgi:ATF/CREB family transcription factor